MKNQKTTRSMRYDQTANDLTNYRTDDPQAIYETKQDDEIKERKGVVKKTPRKR